MEPVIDHLRLARFIGSMEQRALKQGICVETSSDFEALKEVCLRLNNKAPLSALFSPDFYELGPADAFWVKGTNRRGEIVHTQAIRRDFLQGTRLDFRLRQALQRLYCRAPDRPAELASLPWSPGMQNITGTVCYHGEIWLQKGKRGFRGKGLSAVLPRLALGIALAKWNPDYVFGFTDPKLAFKGVAAQYGYMHLQPGGVFWEQAPETISPDDWIAWWNRRDLIYLTQHLP